MYAKDKYARDRVMKSARLLLPYLKDNDTVLDVGCFTQEAKKYFPRTVKYVGIDSVRYHRDTRVMELNHGFEPIKCQAVLCLETLEHLLCPPKILESIQGSLQKDGVFVVSLPNEATIFHRIRCLLGVVDNQCFASEGKHLHLPSLKQSKILLQHDFHLIETLHYISPTACNSSQEWVGKILSLIPDTIHKFLANKFPSLFSRGFIFLCCRKGETPVLANPNERATFIRPPTLDNKTPQSQAQSPPS